MDQKKKIVDLTAEELAGLGYLTDKVPPDVKKRVEMVLANPKYLGNITVFMVECSIRQHQRQSASASQGAADPLSPSTSPTSTVSDADMLFSHYNNNSLAFTVVAPDLITKPPPLLWRSDLAENPFPAPVRGDRHFSIPVKTAHGVTGTPLNAVWPAVAPAILASIKSRGIRYSAMMPVRFSIVEGDRDEYLGPVVVWIAVPPNSAKDGTFRDATPDILRILADAQITDVVVEWYEGTTERLVDSVPMAV